MRPISYEIKRSLTSKFVIILMVVIIGVSSALAYVIASSSSSSSPSFSSTLPQLTLGYYRSGDNITFVGYSHTSTGVPYTGHGMTMTIVGPSGVTKHGTPDPHGFVNVTAPFNASQPFESYDYNYSYSLFGQSTSTPLTRMTISNSTLYTGYSLTTGLIDPKNASSRGFQLFYVGPNGTAAPKTTIYATVFNATEGLPKLEANAVYNRSFSGFNVITVFPTVPPDSLNKSFAIIYQPDTVGSGPVSQFVPYLSTYRPVTQSSLQISVLSGVGGILGILIPILGVLAGYYIYGKDKTTGVLESVLKRPVTRHGLVASRFTANSLSIVISVVVSMAIANLFIKHYLGMYLAPSFDAFFVWTYVVEGLSFLALVYMFSTLVKSQGAILGISITLFLVMAFLWTLLIEPLIFLAFHIAAGSAAYIIGSILFDIVSPGGYHALVEFHYTKQISSIGVNPATYGITVLSIVIIGILWIAVPFLLAVFSAGRRD